MSFAAILPGPGKFANKYPGNICIYYFPPGGYKEAFENVLIIVELISSCKKSRPAYFADRLCFFL